MGFGGLGVGNVIGMETARFKLLISSLDLEVSDLA
jgi:hypothetical protein